MNLGFDVVPPRTAVRKNADLAPSAVTDTCARCGKKIGLTRAMSGADLWVDEATGGVNCVNADMSISGGHRPAKTSSQKTAMIPDELNVGCYEYPNYKYDPSEDVPS